MENPASAVAPPAAVDKAAEAALKHMELVQEANRKRKVFEPVMRVEKAEPCLICGVWKADVRNLPCHVADHTTCLDCVKSTRKRDASGRLVIFCGFCNVPIVPVADATGNTVHILQPDELEVNKVNAKFMRIVFDCRFCEWGGSMADYDAHRVVCTRMPQECPVCRDMLASDRVASHATERFDAHARKLFTTFEESVRAFEKVVEDVTVRFCDEKDAQMNSLRVIIKDAAGLALQRDSFRVLADVCKLQAEKAADPPAIDHDCGSAAGLMNAEIGHMQHDFKVSQAALVRVKATEEAGYKPGARERTMLSGESRQMSYDRVTHYLRASIWEVEQRMANFVKGERLPMSMSDAEFWWGRGILESAITFEHAVKNLYEGLKWLCEHGGKSINTISNTLVVPRLVGMLSDKPGYDLWWLLMCDGGSTLNVELPFACGFRGSLQAVPTPVEVRRLPLQGRAAYDDKVLDVQTAWSTVRKRFLRSIVDVVNLRMRQPLKLLRELCLDDTGLTSPAEERRDEVGKLVRRLMDIMFIDDFSKDIYSKGIFLYIDVDYLDSTKRCINELRYICNEPITWPFEDVREGDDEQLGDDEDLEQDGFTRSPWFIVPRVIDVDAPSSPSYSPTSPSYDGDRVNRRLGT